jgi:RNA polymerase subunit RPABC4/transcription elongation factor Spt4
VSIFSLNDSPIPDDRLSPKPATTAPCVQCGVSVSKASKFCPECGAATSTACSHCGVAIPTTAKFCLECGASQSPQQDAPVTSDSSKPFAQPNGTEAEPNGGRLQAPADAEIEDMPLFGWASSSVSEDSEPKELSGPLKLVLICGALVLAIACVWGFTQYQQENAVAHYKRGEELKSNNDLIGAQRELKACLVECPDGWQKNTAREELERIEPLIAAQGKPQQAQPSAEEKAEAEQQEEITGTPIDYDSFYAKSLSTGLPVGKRYRIDSVDVALDSNAPAFKASNGSWERSTVFAPAFFSRSQQEDLLKQSANLPSAHYLICTVVVSMSSNGKIYLFQAENCRPQ